MLTKIEGLEKVADMTRNVVNGVYDEIVVVYKPSINHVFAITEKDIIPILSNDDNYVFFILTKEDGALKPEELKKLIRREYSWQLTYKHKSDLARLNLLFEEKTIADYLQHINDIKDDLCSETEETVSEIYKLTKSKDQEGEIRDTLDTMFADIYEQMLSF